MGNCETVPQPGSTCSASKVNLVLEDRRKSTLPTEGLLPPIPNMELTAPVNALAATEPPEVNIACRPFFTPSPIPDIAFLFILFHNPLKKESFLLIPSSILSPRPRTTPPLSATIFVLELLCLNISLRLILKLEVGAINSTVPVIEPSVFPSPVIVVLLTAHPIISKLYRVPTAIDGSYAHSTSRPYQLLT